MITERDEILWSAVLTIMAVVVWILFSWYQEKVREWQ